MHLAQSNERQGNFMQLMTTNEGPSFKLALKDGTFFDVTSDLLTMYQQAYPKINVQEEMAKMVAWHLSNESRRKTRKGIKRSINSWLNAAKPAQFQNTIAQRDHAKNTTMHERLTDDSWAN